MSNRIVYVQGVSYPNLRGLITYPGSVDTLLMTVSLEANELTSGPFTGALTRVDGDSENQTSSTFEWSYTVTSADTADLETYDVCLRITHVSGEIELINLGIILVEASC